MLALVFCVKCRSNRVDVRGWASPTVAILRCSACGHEAEVEGFSVGRTFDEPALDAPTIALARRDLAVHGAGR